MKFKTPYFNYVIPDSEQYFIQYSYITSKILWFIYSFHSSSNFHLPITSGSPKVYMVSNSRIKLQTQDGIYISVGHINIPLEKRIQIW